MKKWLVVLMGVTVFMPSMAMASETLLTIKDANNNSYSLSLQILAVMTALTLLPALLLGMTSFTRIIIVLGILRQAIGMQQTPNNQILIGLSLFMTLFIMMPVFSTVHETAIQPYLDGKMSAESALKVGSLPVKDFMFKQTRERDLSTFLELSKTTYDNNVGPENVNLSVLLPAFISSELKTAFQMGFVLFVPFLVIDLVVASVLMAMGMMMLSPLVISLPFKLMLFVLVDGWALIVGTLAESFST